MTASVDRDRSAYQSSITSRYTLRTPTRPRSEAQDGGASLVSSGSSSSSCQWHSAPFYGTGPYGATDIAVGVGAAPTPDAQLYLAWCGALSVFFWLSPSTGVTPASAQPLA